MKKDKKPIFVNMDMDFAKELKVLCIRRNTTVSAYIIEAVKQKMAKDLKEMIQQ